MRFNWTVELVHFLLSSLLHMFKEAVWGDWKFFFFWPLKKMAHGGHKWMDMASNYSRDVVSKRDSVGTKEPKVSQEIFHEQDSSQQSSAWPVDLRQDGSGLSCRFHPPSSEPVQTQHFSGARWKTSAAVVHLRQGSRFKRKLFFFFAYLDYNRWLFKLLLFWL